MKLKAIKNSIIFRFVDKVNIKGEFEKGTTESGIMLNASVDDSAKSPRWVNVIDVGPECESVKPGMQMLLPALRWTAASKFDGELYWKSDESQAAVVRDSETSELVPVNKTIIVKRSKPKVTTSASGLMVIGNLGTDTPSAEVVSISAKCEADLAGSTVYFHDESVFEDFKHNGEQFTFIKEDDVIVYTKPE